MTGRILAVLLAMGAGLPAVADEGPSYQIELKERFACVTPTRKGQARADGGSIDVRTSKGSTLTMRMTGATAAISYLGCTSSASGCFRLTQEVEITCSDPSVSQVVLTLESSLVGYVSSARKAGARMRMASASFTPQSWDSSPLAISHPEMCAVGGQAQQCNQHLPPLKGPPMPLGRYLLVADFVIDATAGGLCNARAVADFSPEAKTPSEWTQTVDPFPNANKDGFGFLVTINAEAPEGAPPPPPPRNVPLPPLTPAPLAPPPVGPPANDLKPLGRRDSGTARTSTAVSGRPARR